MAKQKEAPVTKEDVCIIELKVSGDGGETWQRRMVDMSDLQESGLRKGEIFILNSERYHVIADDFGELGVEKPDTKKKRK